MARSDSYRNSSASLPKVLVVVPCRGADFGLEENLLSIKNQSYENFSVLCVVDSESDGSLPHIRHAGMKYTKANSAIGNGSGKVKAIATAIKKYKEYGVYAIADSDIRAPPCWLSNLVRQLSGEGVGLATSFPMFVPADSSIWSKFKSAWGLVGIGLIKSKITRFGWGGSLAFRKGLISSAKEFKRFSNSLSDDIALTRLAKEKGLGIAYNGRCAPIVYCKETFGTFFEWANRQTALSILGNKRIFAFGVAYYSIELALLILGVALSFANLLFFVLALLYFANVYRGYRSLPKPSMLYIPILVVLPLFYLLNLFIAHGMHSIKWRGRYYQLAQIQKPQNPNGYGNL
ncbi:MAG: glycosyltransferase family 2 protein [Candidatus Micrarchaeaceae archaeon]